MVDRVEQAATLSDAELALTVERAVAGDQEAFGRLYETYIDRVHRHIDELGG